MGKLLEVLLLFIGVISLINAIINLVRVYYKRGFSLHKIHGVVRYKVLSKKEIKQLSFKEKMKQ